MVKNQGFTLIELLIVISIIGILAAIAYPNYLKYVKESNRVDIMAELQNIGKKIETKKIEKRSYSAITSTDIIQSTSYPAGTKPLYNISLDMNTNGWKITATPITTAQMNGDGDITLDSQGNKCRGATCGKDQEWRK